MVQNEVKSIELILYLYSINNVHTRSSQIRSLKKFSDNKLYFFCEDNIIESEKLKVKNYIMHY